MTRFDFAHGHGGELDAYYASDEWAKRKTGYFARRERRCEACGSRDRIDLHHVEYSNLYFEADEELVALCRNCHAECHYLQQLFGWALQKMTAEFISYRGRQVEHARLLATNDELRHLQDRLRGRQNTANALGNGQRQDTASGSVLPLFGLRGVDEQPIRVERASHRRLPPRVHVGTTCKVCGGRNPKLEMCVAGDGLVHSRCSYQRRTPVCSEACSILWLEGTGH